jgi:hypothetical protein
MFDLEGFINEAVNCMPEPRESENQQLILSKFQESFLSLVKLECSNPGTKQPVSPDTLSQRISYWLVEPNTPDDFAYNYDLMQRYRNSDALLMEIMKSRPVISGVMRNTDNWYADLLPDMSQKSRQKLRHKVVKIIQPWLKEVLAKLADPAKLADYVIKPTVNEQVRGEFKGADAGAGKGCDPAASFVSDLWRKPVERQSAERQVAANGGGGASMVRSGSLSGSE